jgi:hypothetical protein
LVSPTAKTVSLRTFPLAPNAGQQERSFRAGFEEGNWALVEIE